VECHRGILYRKKNHNWGTGKKKEENQGVDMGRRKKPSRLFHQERCRKNQGRECGGGDEKRERYHSVSHYRGSARAWEMGGKEKRERLREGLLNRWEKRS